MMRTTDMGRVTVEARVTSVADETRAQRGEIPPEQIRSVTIDDALVDTGATTLGLPAALLRQLGLDTPFKTKRSRNTTGEYEVKIYGPVRLWLFGRDMALDVMEVGDGCPVLIGQLPLEYMQLVVDMVNHRVVKSPANGGEWILDMY